MKGVKIDTFLLALDRLESHLKRKVRQAKVVPLTRNVVQRWVNEVRVARVNGSIQNKHLLAGGNEEVKACMPSVLLAVGGIRMCGLPGLPLSGTLLLFLREFYCVKYLAY